ncbi:hypothetical protein BDV96DRAFT_670572 [Lophiotrema nucula]|uniref:Uncharacterized protein n=1 Tax=Lophiotrema nucula TaxID=690887 RepID=A0A6A5YND9_9PLEO|nr:hypothetical protein BDV96DRAFT_670572 [Lophiotrema nucula]
MSCRIWLFLLPIRSSPAVESLVQAFQQHWFKGRAPPKTGPWTHLLSEMAKDLAEGNFDAENALLHVNSPKVESVRLDILDWTGLDPPLTLWVSQHAYTYAPIKREKFRGFPHLTSLELNFRRDPYTFQDVYGSHQRSRHVPVALETAVRSSKSPLRHLGNPEDTDPPHPQSAPSRHPDSHEQIQ